MSSEFLMTLSGTSSDAPDTANRILLALKSMKFELVDYVDELAYDRSDRTFEATDRFAANDVMSPAERLMWKVRNELGDGFITSLVSPWATINLLFGVVERSFNCYVGIPKGRLESLFTEDGLGSLYGLYCRIADAGGAVGGFAGMDRDPVFLAPDAVMAAILDDPGNPGYRASLGILSSDGLPRAELDAKLGAGVRIQQWGRYWILEDCDFLDVYGSVGD
jgi:hypothetical protein